MASARARSTLAPPPRSSIGSTSWGTTRTSKAHSIVQHDLARQDMVRMDVVWHHWLAAVEASVALVTLSAAGRQVLLTVRQQLAPHDSAEPAASGDA